MPETAIKNKKGKKVLVVSLFLLVIFIAIGVKVCKEIFYAYEDKAMLEQLQEQLNDISRMEVFNVDTRPFYSSETNGIGIYVSVFYCDSSHQPRYGVSTYERADDAFLIRNCVQRYIDEHQVSKYQTVSNIELIINYVSSVPGEREFVSFSNQYDDHFNRFFNKENISLKKLNSIQCYDSSYTEKDIEKFCDSKSLFISVKNITNFSFLQKFDHLEYVSFSDVKTSTKQDIIEQCKKYLPENCELYFYSEKVL